MLSFDSRNSAEYFACFSAVLLLTGSFIPLAVAVLVSVLAASLIRTFVTAKMYVDFALMLVTLMCFAAL